MCAFLSFKKKTVLMFHVPTLNNPSIRKTKVRKTHSSYVNTYIKEKEFTGGQKGKEGCQILGDLTMFIAPSNRNH